MSTSTITTKGQVTIPQQVRERMGVKPGDRVSFTVRVDGTVVVEPLTRDVASLRGLVKGKSRRRSPPTVEEMNEAIRRGGSGR